MSTPGKSSAGDQGLNMGVRVDGSLSGVGCAAWWALLGASAIARALAHVARLSRLASSSSHDSARVVDGEATASVQEKESASLVWAACLELFETTFAEDESG